MKKLFLLRLTLQHHLPSKSQKPSKFFTILILIISYRIKANEIQWTNTLSWASTCPHSASQAVTNADKSIIYALYNYDNIVFLIGMNSTDGAILKERYKSTTTGSNTFDLFISKNMLYVLFKAGSLYTLSLMDLDTNRLTSFQNIVGVELDGFYIQQISNRYISISIICAYRIGSK